MEQKLKIEKIDIWRIQPWAFPIPHFQTLLRDSPGNCQCEVEEIEEVISKSTKSKKLDFIFLLFENRTAWIGMT